VDNICKTLREFGFREVDYVYEPGQFALRGSILDVYSYSHEFPFRLDFFGDDIDSIRTFEVETQLSKERCNSIDIVPELTSVEEKESILKFLPQDTLLVMKDPQFVRESIERIYQEGFSQQALQERMAEATEMEQRQIEKEMQRDSQIITGSQFANDAESFRTILLKEDKTAAVIHFNTKPQPLFHKNFELLSQTLEDYLLQGFKLYILADSAKQQERLKDIFAEMKQGIEFIPVDKTLHEGFIDVDARLCLFTDHQIFDRFHKYNLKSDKARSGKVALTLKEIQQFEVGDYVVHVDHGIG
jgi:transcription-repair coupling factor (superfamily II helicase)